MTLNEYALQSYNDNIKWWVDIETGLPIDRNVGELLMLIVTELSEAFEGYRKDQMDKHLPNRLALEVELADAFIRLFDFAGKHGLDIEGAYQEKRLYNARRIDHTHEARRLPGGKKF